MEGASRPTGRWRATCSRRPTRPSRRSTPVTRPGTGTTSARSSGTCCCRSTSTPSSPRSAASSPSTTSPAGSPPRCTAATRTSSARPPTARRRRRRGQRGLGGDQGAGEAAGLRHRRPPDTLPALLYAAKASSERSRRCPAAALRPRPRTNRRAVARAGGGGVVDGVDPEQAFRDAVRVGDACHGRATLRTLGC